MERISRHYEREAHGAMHIRFARRMNGSAVGRKQAHATRHRRQAVRVEVDRCQVGEACWTPEWNAAGGKRAGR
jgi:hypothetical protein